MTNKPQYRQEWIFELLKLEGLTHAVTFGKYLVEFGKTEMTFNKDWKVANERYKLYQSDVNKAKKEVSIAYEVETLKQGLKSKFERTLNLQNQIDYLQKTLNDNLTTDVIVVSGKVQNVNRKLSIQEKALIIREIKGLSALIGTNEGDSAPTKSQVEVTEKPIDLSKMPLEDLKTMQEILKKQNDNT